MEALYLLQRLIQRYQKNKKLIGEHTIQQISYFKYLGSIIQNNREIEGDVNYMSRVNEMEGCFECDMR